MPGTPDLSTLGAVRGTDRRARGAVALIAAAGLGVTACGLGPAEPLKGAGEPTVPTPSVTAPSVSPGLGEGARRPGERRPNILLITVDDAAPDDLEHMPHVRRLIADRGVTMTNMVAPTPICVPARASLLTGQYAPNHGALTISGDHGGVESFDDRRTLPTWLRAAGYDTMFVGKYLNGYGVSGRPPTYVPPGWSDWRGSVDWATYDFSRASLSTNGEVVDTPDYNTDVFAANVTEMLSAPERHENPWYLSVNYVAPHVGDPIESDDPYGMKTTVPAQRHRDSFADVPLSAKPNRFERRPGDKAMRATHDRARWDAEARAALREANQQRLESLQAVDEAVREHIWVLRRTKQLARTVVVFTSDNGYLLGEHNLGGKLWHYRDSHEVPTVIRGPGIPRGTVVDDLAANVDLPATFTAMAEATPRRRLDGVDLRPVLRGEARGTRVVPIAAYPVRGGSRPLYTGVRHGERWNYVRLRSGEELFDLAADPYELTNLARDRSHRPILRRLRKISRTLRDCAGAACRQFDGRSSP